MKIGILTLPFNNNYGGYLQCYALMSVLKHMGHDVELINRKPNKRTFNKRVVAFIKNVLRLFLGQKPYLIIPDQQKELEYKGYKMMPFVQRHIYPISMPLWDSYSFRKYVENRYDAIIVGSDQIWRPDYVPNIQDFYLADVDDEKLLRISYAASFGTSNPNYTAKEIRDCGKAIMKFLAVGLREQSGINVINNFEWKAKEQSVLLDPTMLMDQQAYLGLLNNGQSNLTGKIFCYVLDLSEDALDIIHNVSNKLGLDYFHIIDPYRWKKYAYQMPSIEDWLMGIRDCEFVITDSFHGTVFSIIMNKPFLVRANKERGIDRFETLLSKFHLLDRIIYTSHEIDEKLNTEIDWCSVNSLLSIEKDKSIQFLFRNLTPNK